MNAYKEAKMWLNTGYGDDSEAVEVAEEVITALLKQLEASDKVVDAVASLNLDKVEGYMLLGKSYKDIICEALKEYEEIK